MAKAKWEREQIFGKLNMGKIPYDKETEAWVNGTLTGVGKPKEAKSGDKTIVVAVQPKVKVGDEYKYTFSTNTRMDKAKQEEFREKMLAKGYIEQKPVFVNVKYDPKAVDMYALLSEMREMKEGKNSFNAIAVKYTVIQEKDKDGNVEKTVSGAEKKSNFAAVAFMDYPPEREAEFKAILEKHLFVDFKQNVPEPEAAAGEKTDAKDTKVAETNEGNDYEMSGLDDIDIPF